MPKCHTEGEKAKPGKRVSTGSYSFGGLHASQPEVAFTARGASLCLPAGVLPIFPTQEASILGETTGERYPKQGRRRDNRVRLEGEVVVACEIRS